MNNHQKSIVSINSIQILISYFFIKEDEVDNRRGGKQQSMTYNAEKIIGNGSFGVVFKATIAETGETVAIKKVF